MRLEIESVDIKDIQAASKTYAEDGVLFINIKELEELILRDPRIKSVDINLVYPGDNIRVLNLLDVIQPRCKIDQADADFPGFIGKDADCRKGTYDDPYEELQFSSPIPARTEKRTDFLIWPAPLLK